MFPFVDCRVNLILLSSLLFKPIVSSTLSSVVILIIFALSLIFSCIILVPFPNDIFSMSPIDTHLNFVLTMYLVFMLSKSSSSIFKITILKSYFDFV